jgi:hypothetical protein
VVAAILEPEIPQRAPIWAVLPCATPQRSLAQRGRWQDRRVEYHLAQVNIARLRAPIDSPELADFVADLDPVNEVADAAPGFIWRLQTEDGNATSVRAFEWDQAGSAGVIVNMSVWQSVEALAAYVYSGPHVAVMRRRREWFERMRVSYSALWWVPAGIRPTTGDAEDRVVSLRIHGPTPHAFTLKEHYPPPGSAGSQPLLAPGDWMCPA